jgi:hypothetical protein
VSTLDLYSLLKGSYRVSANVTETVPYIFHDAHITILLCHRTVSFDVSILLQIELTIIIHRQHKNGFLRVFSPPVFGEVGVDQYLVFNIVFRRPSSVLRITASGIVFFVLDQHVLSWIVIVLSHSSKSPLVDKCLNFDPLS